MWRVANASGTNKGVLAVDMSLNLPCVSMSMESASSLADVGARCAPLLRTQRSRLLVSPAADGATNMAFDEALLRRARRTGETLYRVYAWSGPTVSLGRNQSARGVYDLALAGARAIDFVRRPTGGRAILHHREITYSVTGPVTSFGSLRESYRTVNRLLLEALRALGVTAAEAETSARAPAPGRTPCFVAPAAGELVVGGCKLVGSAQVREADAFLQHGSILVDDDQPVLADLVPDSDPLPPAATLRGLTGRVVTVNEFADALTQALAARDGLPPESLVPDESLLDDVRSLISARYASSAWTWHR
jgi:lipoyl(octanoyl) transferase